MIPMDTVDFVRAAAGAFDHGVGSHAAVNELALQNRRRRPAGPDRAQLYVCGRVVVKLQPTGTDPVLLRRRLQSITQPATGRFWVQPLLDLPRSTPDRRLATIWPRVEVLAPTDPPPWTQLGTLLAGLHQSLPTRPSAPQSSALDRLTRAVDYLQLRRDNDLRWLAALGEDLTDRLRRPRRTALIHGDFHLGQLGRPSADGVWSLLDPDDVGIGDPAWDLARPAGLWAAGLLHDAAWMTLLAAYRHAGGPAVPPTGNPWPDLDLTARGATLIAAVQSLRSGQHPATTRALLEACRRMQNS